MPVNLYENYYPSLANRQFNTAASTAPVGTNTTKSSTPIITQEDDEYLQDLRKRGIKVGPEVDVTPDTASTESDTEIYGDIHGKFGKWTEAQTQNWINNHPNVTKGMSYEEGVRAFRDNAIRNRYAKDPRLNQIMALNPQDRDYIYNNYLSNQEIEKEVGKAAGWEAAMGTTDNTKATADSLKRRNDEAFNKAYKNTLRAEAYKAQPLIDKYYKSMSEDSTPEEYADYIKQFDELAENSPYWKVYGGTRKLNLSDDSKVFELAKFMALSQYNESLAFDHLSKDFQDQVYKNTNAIDQLGNAMVGAFTDTVASLAYTGVAVDAIKRGLTQGVQGVYDAFNTDLAKWADGAFKYNTLDWAEQRQSEKNGGISENQVRLSYDMENGDNAWKTLFNASTFPTLIEQSGPTIAAMVTSYLTGGIGNGAAAAGRKAFSLFKNLGAGFNTLKNLTKAGKFLRGAGDILAIELPAMQAGAMDAHESLDNAKLELAPIIDAKYDGASKLLDMEEGSEEYKQQYNKIWSKAISDELQKMGITDEVIKKETDAFLKDHQTLIQDRESGRMVAQYNPQDVYNAILNKYIDSIGGQIKGDLDQDLDRLKSSLGTTALQQFVMGTAINSEGFLHWKRGQLDRGVQARIAQRKKNFLDNFGINAEGKVYLKKKTELPVLVESFKEPLGEGFQEMGESITGAFAQGYGVNDYTNYLENKYNSDNIKDSATMLSNICAGLSYAGKAATDQERLQDFTYGFLGSLTGALNPVTAITGFRNRLLPKQAVRNADGTAKLDKNGQPVTERAWSRKGKDYLDYILADALRNPVYEAFYNRRARQKELSEEQDRWQKIVDKNKDAFFTNAAIANWGNRGTKAAEKGDKFGYYTSQLGQDIQSIQWLDDIADTELADALQQRMENVAHVSTKIGEDGPTQEQAALLDEVRNGVDSKALYKGKSDEDVLKEISQNAQKLLDTQKKVRQTRAEIMDKFDKSGIEVTKDTVDAMVYQKVASDYWKQMGNEANQLLGGTYVIGETNATTQTAEDFFDIKRDDKGKVTNISTKTDKDGKDLLTKEAFNTMSPVERAKVLELISDLNKKGASNEATKLVNDLYRNFLKAGHTQEEFNDAVITSALSQRHYDKAVQGYAEALNSPRQFERYAAQVRMGAVRNAQEKVYQQNKTEWQDKAKKAKSQTELFDAVKYMRNSDLSALLNSDDYSEEQKGWIKDTIDNNTLIEDINRALAEDSNLTTEEKAGIFEMFSSATVDATNKEDSLKRLRELASNESFTKEQRNFLKNLLGKVSSNSKTRTATTKESEKKGKTYNVEDAAEEKEKQNEEAEKYRNDKTKYNSEGDQPYENSAKESAEIPEINSVADIINQLIRKQARLQKLNEQSRGNSRAAAQRKNVTESIKEDKSTLYRLGLNYADIDALITYFAQKAVGMSSKLDAALQKKLDAAEDKFKARRQRAGMQNVEAKINRFFEIRSKGKGKTAREAAQYKELQDWIKKTFDVKGDSTATVIARVLKTMFDHHFSIDSVKWYFNDKREKVQISDKIREIVSNGITALNKEFIKEEPRPSDELAAQEYEKANKKTHSPEDTAEGQTYEKPNTDSYSLEDEVYENPQNEGNYSPEEGTKDKLPDRETLKQIPGWSQGPEVRAADEIEDDNQVVRIAPQFIGNPLSYWNTSELRKNRLEASDNPVVKSLYEWLDAHNIKLQNIIDEEIGNLKWNNLRVRIISVNPNMAEASVFGEHKIKLLAFEASKAVKDAHKKKNGELIKAGGKEYLVIGTLGYSAQEGMENADAVKQDWQDTYNWLNDRSEQYFKGHEQEEFFVDEAYTQITAIQQGRLIKAINSEDNPNELISIGEMLSDERRDPERGNKRRKFTSLAWGYNTSVGLFTTGTSTKEVMPIVSEKAGTGAAYVLIPGPDGGLYPVYIQPTWYGHGDIGKRYIKNDSALAATIGKLVERLTSTNHNERVAAVKELHNYLVFTDDYNVLVGTSQMNTVTLVTEGSNRQTFDVDNEADRKAFIEAFNQAGFRVNITRLTMSNEEAMQMYDAAGALMTDVKYLGRVGGSFTIASIDRESGKPIINRGEGYKTVTEKKTSNGYTQVIINSVEYYKDEDGNYWKAEDKSKVTDSNLQKKIDEYILYDQDKGWQKEKPNSETSTIEYLILSDQEYSNGLNKVLLRDRGNIKMLDEAEGKKFLNKLADKRRQRNAEIENRIAKYKEAHKNSTNEQLLKEEQRLQEVIENADEQLGALAEGSKNYIDFEDGKGAATKELEWVREQLAESNEATEDYDEQGNPVDKDGKLITEKVTSIDDITDDDFEKPTRSIELPKIPDNVDKAIGAEGKPVIIKKNIFERNKERHDDITPEQSREILRSALYTPTLYGQNQKRRHPYNWVVINVKGRDGKNRLVLLEINSTKDNVEIIHWHYIDDRGLDKMKRQAIREDGQLLILPSVNSEEAGALSSPTDGLSSDDKDSKKSENKQENEKKKTNPIENLGGSDNFSTFEAQYKKPGNGILFYKALKGTPLGDRLQTSGIAANDAAGVFEILKEWGVPLSEGSLTDYKNWLDNVKNCYAYK